MNPSPTPIVNKIVIPLPVRTDPPPPPNPQPRPTPPEDNSDEEPYECDEPAGPSKGAVDVYDRDVTPGPYWTRFGVVHRIITYNTPRTRDLDGTLTLYKESGDETAFQFLNYDNAYALGTTLVIWEPGHSGCGIHDWHSGMEYFDVVARKWSGPLTLKAKTVGTGEDAGPVLREATITPLPVQFKTYPDAELGPDKAHKRNLPHLAGYDAYYGKEWTKCVSKVWETSHKINLIDYLEGADNPSTRTLFEENLKWKVDGTDQTRHELDYGTEPAEDRHQHRFVEVVSKSGGVAIDRLIITVVPRSTKTKWDDWLRLEGADLSWLAELPPMFSRIETTLGPDGYLPRPDRNFNPYLYAVPHSIDTFYHPGASYEIRSFPTANGHGGQVTYDSSGAVITSGVRAGSADKVAPFPLPGGHLNADVKPLFGLLSSMETPWKGVAALFPTPT